MEIKTSGILVRILFLSLLSSCTTEPSIILKEPVLGMEFVKIQQGDFLMGDHEGLNDSIAVHKVRITEDYWLGKTEVTQAQWQAILGKKELHPEKPSPFRNQNPEYPIVSISYHDIELFLDKLNKRSAEYQFRLPTEAEWEYACRAGTKSPFSFGDVLNDSFANYNAEIPSKYSVPGKYLGHPTPVGSYTQNQWGLYDMHGNVWEWVSDWHEPYSIDTAINPSGPKAGKEKIIRGGSWYFGAENAKSSYMRTHAPHLWGFSIGFRLICEKKK